MNREERDSLIGTMTTLCYLEKDDSYLMLHRVKKKNDVNLTILIGFPSFPPPFTAYASSSCLRSLKIISRIRCDSICMLT